MGQTSTEVGGKPACRECGGSGWIPTPTGKVRRCACKVHEDVRSWLTPSFADALRVKPEEGWDFTAYDGRNVFIQNSAKLPDPSFNRIYRSAFKSYLIEYRLRHKVALNFRNVGGAREIANAAFARAPGEPGYGDWPRLERAPLLLIYLCGDPPNERYSQVLCSLIKHRGRDEPILPTWVVTSYSLYPDNDRALERIYGAELVNYIRPRAGTDKPGLGGGHFKELDQRPFIDAFRKAKAAATGHVCTT